MTKEEAINIYQGLINPRIKEAFEFFAPELRESEDERIRKGLIKLLTVASEVYLVDSTGIKKDSYLAYLEKQKENIEKEYVFRPLAGTDIAIAALQAIRRADEGDRLVLAFNGVYIPVRKGCNANKIVDIYEAFIEKQKEQKVDIDKLRKDIYQSGYNDGYQHGKEDEQKEQKPPITGNDFGWIDELKHDLEHPEELDQKVDDVLKQRKGIRALEWSDTDTIGWDEAFACVTRAEKAAKNEEELQNAVTAEKWLKEIKFKYYVHPVKQEWSEEDQLNLNWVIAILNGEPCDLDIQVESLIAWLRSLRPQPRWKPSDK